MMDALLTHFNLRGAQQAAAARLDQHLAVMAGAGSGKTRALVARYLHFVARGVPVRALVAITFTEKAAREMRSRVHGEVERWLAQPPAPEVAARLRTALAELDAARIGTIHALCADLLRVHPAEAGVDPLFAVLEEGVAATLQARAIEAALAWAAADVEAARLFAVFKENDLRHSLQALINRRLSAVPALERLDPLAGWDAAFAEWLAPALTAPAVTDALAVLAGAAARQTDDALEVGRRAVLAGWTPIAAARNARDWPALLAALRDWRAVFPRANAGRQGSWAAADLADVRAAALALRAHYDTTLAWLAQCDWALDRQAADLLPAFRRLGERALAEYQALKDQRGALDFDDLEAQAGRLLKNPAAVTLAAQALLVDEFQDTNERQRQIVYALARFPTASTPAANLFVVGDEKQSIYRFRGAEVTVFQDLRRDLARAGGETLALDLTFRAHAPLLETVERLLRPLLGETLDPARPYRVPFAPLTAYRPAPDPRTPPPFVEFQLGVGADTAAGRRAAAAALAARLAELHAREGYAWEQMALLFRASAAFPIYEDALEAAGLPFVTVAGRGFYDRPEIRDLLNALAAIADPSDDLALAGLLRSPALGLTDADLFRLRFSAGAAPQPLFEALRRHGPAGAAETITALHAVAGRRSVAELLKAYLDRTHYRALLQAEPSTSRLSRNVDKLLADAHRSGLVALGDFLEYVASLRDVGAREGEAPAEAGGAVQLMTIHKSKGLEFPIVALADAGHARPGGAGAAQFDAALGVLLPLRAAEAQPVMWRLGGLAEDDRAAAEDLRVLYVACTRAKDRLLVNGHARISAAKSDPGRLVLTGWLSELGAVLGLEQVRVPDPELTAPLPVALGPAWDAALRVTLLPLPAPASPPPAAAVPAPARVSQSAARWLTPLPPPPGAPAFDAEARLGRVIARGADAPARLIGTVIHAALRRWWFPDQPDFEARLRPAALAAGLGEEAGRRAALREARVLLSRFQAQPLWREIDQAQERYAEWPYVMAQDSGVIDLLYRGAEGWTVVDFKTDELRDAPAVAGAVACYTLQVRRYLKAAAAHLGAPPRGRLVLLNAQAAVQVVPITLAE